MAQVPSGAYGSDRESAPLATAAALAYALLSPGRYDALQVLALAVTAALTGALVRAGARWLWGDGAACAGPAVPVQRSVERLVERSLRRRQPERVPEQRDGRQPVPPPRSPVRRHTLPVVGWGQDTVARRVLTLGFAAACSRPLGGGRLAAGPAYAVGLLVVLVLTALCDAALAALLTAARAGHPFPPALRDEVRELAGIGSTVCAGAVVMALGAAEAGLWALPVVGVPLLLTQMSLRGQAAVRATYRQTIGSLARATEVAGYTPAGHARRVSELATAVGRELGLPARHLMLLEYAALMHDIGQLSLVDPVPGGATEPLDAERQQEIAALGGDVVRLTGAPPEVALIVERQAHPYREQPLAGRIVRAVNAYEDLTGAEAALDQRLAALERLRLATAHDYDPRVVEALTRVLARHPTSAWLDARGDGKDVG
ncbi:MAG TPA: metal-dependent phosphohydrolase [Streptomyces sp.]